MKIRTLIYLIPLLWARGILQAQDLHLTQFSSNKPLLNPAFTGSGEGMRFSMNNRAQWMHVGNAYIQNTLSADWALPKGKNRSAVGIVLHDERAARNVFSLFDFLLNYSFTFQFGGEEREQFIGLGLQLGLKQFTWNSDNFVYPDQIVQGVGVVYNSQDPVVPFGSILAPDFSTGVVYQRKRFWASASVFHLTQPNLSFSLNNPGIQTHLPIRLSLATGGNIPLGPRGNRDSFVLMPEALFMKQQRFNQLNLGSRGRSGILLYGLFYRLNYLSFDGSFIHSDALALMGGIQKGMFSVSYSYDYTVSRLTNGQSGGSHELALSLDLGKRPK